MAAVPGDVSPTPLIIIKKNTEILLCVSYPFYLLKDLRYVLKISDSRAVISRARLHILSLPPLGSLCRPLTSSLSSHYGWENGKQVHWVL
jgi:hypothetical protein